MVIGFMRSDYCFEICRFERFAATEDPLRVVQEVGPPVASSVSVASAWMEMAMGMYLTAC